MKYSIVRQTHKLRNLLRFITLGARHSSSTLAQIVLRPYQEHCLDACIDALNLGSTRLGVSLPTGSGKTTVFISLISRIPPPASNSLATRSLIIVNSIELARQSAAQVARLFPDWSVEIEQGTKHKASGKADVTVATYQTLLRGDRFSKFDPQTLKAVVIDEAHHAAAPSYRRLLSHFDPSIKHPDPNFIPPKPPHKIPILGFSATFSRHDGLRLGAIFERIVYHRDFLEMIKDQWLCDIRFTSVSAKLDLKGVIINSRNGDFNPTSLAQVVNTKTVNDLVVKTWIDRAATRRSTLVFCVNIAHVHALTQTFRSYGIDARYVYSETPAAERQALITGFKAGQFPILINCAILTEGTDIPNIDCVMVARPTRSRNVFAQMIGRGMRLSPNTGKTDCRVIDLVDSMARVSGIVSIPTLFGLDPSEVNIQDETPDSLEERASQIIATPDTNDNIPNPTSVTYTDYDDPFSLIKDTSGAPHINLLSQNSWVGCGNNIYVLECLGKGFIRIEQVENEDGENYFEAHFAPAMLPTQVASAMKVSAYRRSRSILTAATLSDAVRACDTFAINKVVRGVMALGLLRSAKWRFYPASEGQKKLLTKRWAKKGIGLGEIPDETDRMKKIAKMTKGEAANIISRMKHGAQSRFEKKVKAEKRALALAAKDNKHRAQFEVQVGILEPSVDY